MNLQPPRASERQAVLQQWFRQATQLHLQDKHAEAEAYYQAILKTQPNHIDAMHLLGLLRFQQGRYGDSLKLIRHVLKANPNLPTAHANLANSLAKTGRPQEALASYDKAIELKPDYVEAHNNRGVVLLKEFARPLDALACWDRVLLLKPDHAEALYNRGLALTQLDRLDEALASYDKAVRIQPNYPEALNNRGPILVKLRRNAEALASYDAAIAQKPDYAEAFNNRGVLLAELARPEEALDSYGAAIALRPDYAEALNNRGVVLKQLKRTDEAIACYRRALALRPDYPEAFNNHGVALRDLDRLDEELACYDRAIALKPDYIAAHNNRGMALHLLGRHAESLASFDRGLAIDPANVEGLFGRSLVTLLTGDFGNGWAGYARRFEQKEAVSSRLPSLYPQWKGEDLKGKRIIVGEEQGVGDVLQFSRYVPLLAAAGADVTFVVRSGLHRLLHPIAWAARLTENRPDEPFDFQSSLLDLPAGFQTTPATIPSAQASFTAEPHLVDKWRPRLGESGIRIGIAWQGNPDGSIDLGRSIPVRCFLPLAQIPGVRLISLQKNHGLDQLNDLPPSLPVETLGSDFDAGPDVFLDTAAVMASLDLIVTSDTSIAHLAGGLGRPVWLALKAVPDWRWMLDRTDSPWYPTMTLYRQTTRGDWSDVFERMAADLAARS